MNSRRQRNQRRMNEDRYEMQGRRPNEYYDEYQRGSIGHGEYRHPADYYSGRGGYVQDRFENASRNAQRGYQRESLRGPRYNQYSPRMNQDQHDYRDEFDRYNRDYEHRYFDEDYDGNRGFNRHYNMNSDYQNYGRYDENRRPYDEEYRAYDRNDSSPRMGQSWEGIDFERPDNRRDDYEYRGRRGRHYRDMY